ncbi:MAG: 50S ribosomal protein L23 [Bacteroidia bacterium]
MEIIIKPIVTEKMTAQADKLNRYGFLVNKDANKLMIKQAVEKMYGVTVERVNTQNYIGKVRMRNTRAGMQIGIANCNKKAVVTLKQGETIDFYSSI